jgi:prepilin-type N-terminal cleavage/methylation domain-containing protein
VIGLRRLISGQRRALSNDEGGFTLAELSVAILIFGILLTIVSSLYVGTIKGINVAQNVNTNTRQASDMMNEATRMIRAATNNPLPSTGSVLTQPAPAFVSATNESVVIYAYVNLTGSAQQPIMVQFSVNSSRQLIESLWPSTPLTGGYWQFPALTSAPSTVRTLGSVVAPNSGTSTWLFTYLDVNNNPIATSNTGLPTGAVAGALLNTIAAVQITITAQTSLTDATNAVTLENTVGLPNLQLSRSGQ